MHHNDYPMNLVSFLWLIPFILIIFLYILAINYSNKVFRKWPFYRTILFIMGIIVIASACIGPIAENAHTNFVFHMYSHLLLGMLGPLLIALSAPMTLLLRSIPVPAARKVSKLLKSKYIQTVSHPIIASTLNLGGLWLLYTTKLFEAMHHSWLLALIVHLHIFLAGYLFTISIIYIDPTPHRTSFKMRSIVIILYMAGHSILSKWIYVNPPRGVSKQDAELGGMTMYYGGDFIDVIVVIILWYQLYSSSRVKKSTTLTSYSFN
ncbi:cytochrome c oxidase assembly protein [Ureibacillus acetophenoni]|uniref:Putative membrane protein n=1 Tax=Ureibacillus acetophenoni TaxID=614649 RepID=A0A285UTE4_9BACL|nr:cytochrome c oxidase assembly protein [Ureibacillus acetophenoni]SOC43511.1 putative membrane protein [Ureibacillus acetophenoni]